MANIRTRRGLDIKLTGAPYTDLQDALATDVVSVYPGDFVGIKPTLQVKEGDTVKQGSVLFIDKKRESLRFRSPAAGHTKSIVIGKRHHIKEIIIEVASREERESFKAYRTDEIAGLSRQEILDHLLDTGLLLLIRQRPFSIMADPSVSPKSIFVNGMNTAPFQPDQAVALSSEEAAFQVGLDILSRLTEGKVHLCVGPNAGTALTSARNVEIHTFTGPHPSGNTSVHIHHVDPIGPGDTVWTAKAADVALLGKLFLDGAVPVSRVISVAGEGVAEASRKHYRVRLGGSLSGVLNGSGSDETHRVIAGDVLSGRTINASGGLPFFADAITVIPRSRKRYFMGWIVPGLNRFSDSGTFLSKWFKRGSTWSLNTSRNGSLRAMVLTGLYDKYLPMNIMVDFLVRAVLAHDTDEAVQLGILETDPEDFALCAFACPSKMDLIGIMRTGLQEVQAEGL